MFVYQQKVRVTNGFYKGYEDKISEASYRYIFFGPVEYALKELSSYRLHPPTFTADELEAA